MAANTNSIQTSKLVAGEAAWLAAESQVFCGLKSVLPKSSASVLVGLRTTLDAAWVGFLLLSLFLLSHLTGLSVFAGVGRCTF